MMILLPRRVAARRLASPFTSLYATHPMLLRLDINKRAYTSAVERALKPGFIEPSVLIEEERLPSYEAKHFYPMKAGELLHDRYKVVGKLGYGTSSTVWLCRDLHDGSKFVTVKVYKNTAEISHEISAYQHINSVVSDHYGRNYIRGFYHSFEINGPDGKHTCLVHEALGMDLNQLRDWLPDRLFGADLIRQTLRSILRGLSFLHEKAKYVHTDISPRNILLGVVDDSAFLKFEKGEQESPMPWKELPTHTVYVSRPMWITKGPSSLSDFSEARPGEMNNMDFVMPDAYRAPEVVLDMAWSYPIDLWAFAMTGRQVWDLFEAKLPFDPRDEERRYSEEHHLAQMVSIMGPPPLDFLDRSETGRAYWNADGEWVGSVPIPSMSLELAEQRLDGEEKQLFLNFIRKMLQWKPEDRKCITEVFMDEWLLADLIATGQVTREE